MVIKTNQCDSYPESIIVRKFIGKVKVNDIINSWEDILQKKLIKSETKGLINDLIECEPELNYENIKSLIQYMNKQPLIKRIKIAVIAPTPETVIFPIMCENTKATLTIKTFSTMIAAINWITLNS